MLINIFVVVLKAILYIAILRFFDGEKLKDLINYVQIGLTLGLMIGYQVLIRSFELVDFNMVLFFIVTMLADFINEARKSFYVNAENEILNRIAYVDVLTGLSTRRKCEEATILRSQLVNVIIAAMKFALSIRYFIQIGVT